MTEKVVGKIIRSLPSNKAPGPDEISARVLKPVTIAEITNLVNTSFPSNKFAQVWKLAEVIAILKSGDREEPSNTCPISLLPILSKVCERAAHSEFVNFPDHNEKVSKMQSGNRRFHSTETDLRIRDRPFRHVLKAFDSIRHDLMLSKLQSIGVSNAACDWFGSYLSQRSQVVNVANSVTVDVPCITRLNCWISSIFTVCK